MVSHLAGRQLLVDDFLVGSSANLERVFHRPAYAAANPVLAPTEPHESLDGQHGYGGFASAFSGGVWWWPQTQQHYLYYRCASYVCVALSADGEVWRKPALGVNGTNIARHGASNPVSRAAARC